MSSSSVWWRAALAVALMVGFYALAALVVFICWGGTWWLFTSAGRIPIKLIFFMVVGGGIVLWSVLPRWDSFEAPGPLLTAEKHPRLFEVIRAVAMRTGQPVPHEVYLVSDVNAFVANRGGIMGFGSRPVMGIGLPLLQGLSIAEMKAVIAHEFGHYVGGDTRLGPWIYKTRAAIARSVENLASAQSLLTFPFTLYMKLFLRVSHAVSRHQEFQADRVSAEVTSPADAGRALRRVHAIAPAYDLYWRSEVVPVIDGGFRPPLAGGFVSFLDVPRHREIVEESLRTVPEENADPYDTHPPLSQRLAALGAPDEAPPVHPDEAAVSLLGDLGAAEEALVASLLQPGVTLAALGWDDVGARVYAAGWREAVQGEAPLGGVKLAEVRSFVLDPMRFVSLLAPDATGVTEAQAIAFTRGRAGVIVALALVRAGWAVHTAPGRSVEFRRGATTIDLDELMKSVDGPVEAWTARLAELGVDATMQQMTGRQLAA